VPHCSQLEQAARGLGQEVSRYAQERSAAEVAEELRQQQETVTSEQEVVVPKLAVVSCDGGRLHTREPGHGPGVFNPQWRETKNASFERMQPSAASPEDPCPQLPETFRHVEKVASLAESAALEVKQEPEERAVYKGPKRILRTCLSNNLTRMDYPRYRRLGLPITSAPMESLVKQINLRVKGTEMFWNDPTGAEPILQLRAASLSEDDRLDHHLRHRPGSPFTRRSTLQAAA
jgi:hypothetical protein